MFAFDPVSGANAFQFGLDAHRNFRPMARWSSALRKEVTNKSSIFVSDQ
jgi:hypothetical protein